MVDLFVVFQQPLCVSRYVDGTYAHTVSSITHEGSIIRTFYKVIKGFKARRSLGDFIESQITLEAYLYSDFITFLVSTFWFTHMHHEAGFSLETFFTVLAGKCSQGRCSLNATVTRSSRQRAVESMVAYGMVESKNTMLLGVGYLVTTPCSVVKVVWPPQSA